MYNWKKTIINMHNKLKGIKDGLKILQKSLEKNGKNQSLEKKIKFRNPLKHLVQNWDDIVKVNIFLVSKFQAGVFSTVCEVTRQEA